MRAPSTDLLRALRRATGAAAASGYANPSRAQHPVAISFSFSFTRRQTCATQSSPITRHVRPRPRPHSSTTTTQPPPAQNRQASSSASSSSSSKLAPPSTTSTSRSRQINPRAPKHHDRGPASKEETQTDFSKMDILAAAGVEEPATSIDACTSDGFHLNNGVHTSGGKGVMLLGGEAFLWQPWMSTGPTTPTPPPLGTSSRVNATGKSSTSTSTGTGTSASGSASGNGRGRLQDFTAFLDPRGLLTLPPSTLGLLSLLYPKPDLLLLGTGRRLWMLSRDTRRYLSEELGIKVDVMDTPNAAAAYNLLVMERGVDEVGSILIPEGWVGR